MRNDLIYSNCKVTLSVLVLREHSGHAVVVYGNVFIWLTMKPKQANRTRTEFLEFWLVVRTRAPSYWIIEHIHLTSCFDFDFYWSSEQDFVPSQQSAFQHTVDQQLQFLSPFWLDNRTVWLETAKVLPFLYFLALANETKGKQLENDFFKVNRKHSILVTMYLYLVTSRVWRFV